MPVVRPVVLLLLLATAVCARNFRWAGGNMNFNSVYNWLDGFAPSASNVPCGTQFGNADVDITTQLEAGTYVVGEVLRFTGTLVLSNAGATIAFSSPSSPACTRSAIWTGGLFNNDTRNDLTCHQNWVLASDNSPATDVPCAFDTVIFNESATYRTYVSPSTTLVAFANISLGSLSVSSVQDLPRLLPQVNLVDTSAEVLVGPQAIAGACPADPNNPSVFQCTCASSCPSPAMIAAADARARASTIAEANLTLSVMSAYYRRNFNGVFNAASLSMSQQLFVMALRHSSMSLHSALAAAIGEALGDLPAANVGPVSVMLASDNSTVTVLGWINATGSNLLPVGTTSTTSPGNISWMATTSASLANATRVQNIVRTTLSAQLLGIASEISTNTSLQLYSRASSAEQALVATINNLPNPNTTVAIISNTSCLTTCGQTCGNCTGSLRNALVASGLSLAQATNVTNQLFALPSNGLNTSLATLRMIQENIDRATDSGQAALQQALRPVELTSPTIYVGRVLSQTAQLLAIAPQNYNNTVNAIVNALSGFQGISFVTNVRLSFVGALPQGARRRRVVLTPSALALSFSYTTSCAPNDAACLQSFSSNGPLGQTIQQLMDNVLSLSVSTLQNGQCVTANGPDPVCIFAIANATCAMVFSGTQNLTVARQAAYDVILNLTRCGSMPAFPNGTCIAPNPSATSFAQALTQTLQCDYSIPTPAPGGSPGASKSSGDSSIIPIAAASAGGGVLLLAVIALLIHRKRTPKIVPQSKADDRTVVAFENPMFETPVVQFMSAMGLDTAGLYDQPAILEGQGLVKTNPVYNSRENLPQDGDLEKPKDTYLDVAAADKAADAGYLEGQDFYAHPNPNQVQP